MNLLCRISLREQYLIKAIAEHSLVLPKTELSISKSIVDILSKYEFILTDSFDAAQVIDNCWLAYFLHVLIGMVISVYPFEETRGVEDEHEKLLVLDFRGGIRFWSDEEINDHLVLRRLAHLFFIVFK